MADRIVIARHRQVCDLCHGPIAVGERCRLVRDDFWPLMVWFEHLRCPHGLAIAASPVQPIPPERRAAAALSR
ncbi:MAG: hypothetical protein ACI4WT_11680 [Oligosphaeraceae bacterium]